MAELDESIGEPRLPVALIVPVTGPGAGSREALREALRPLAPGGNDFAWAGALAITKEIFQQAGVAEYWAGAERDDLALAAAMRDAQQSLAYAPGAMVVCDGRATARQFFRQARREMELARA